MDVNTQCKITRGRRGRDHMVVGFTTTCTINAYLVISRCCHGRDRMVVVFTTTCTVSESVPITTNVVSLNPVHGEVY